MSKTLSKELVDLTKEYFGIKTDQEVYDRIDNCATVVNKEWHAKDMETFYKETKEYIIGLVGFNNQDRLKRILYPIQYLDKLDILDFGGGIGELSMILSKYNNVSYYDIDGEIKKFAKFISEKTERPITFIDKEEDVFKKKFDMVILMDVLEHLKDPMETTKKLMGCLDRGGFLVTTGLIFAIKKELPMHLPENRKKEEEWTEYVTEKCVLCFFHSTPDETIMVWRKK